MIKVSQDMVGTNPEFGRIKNYLIETLKVFGGFNCWWISVSLTQKPRTEAGNYTHEVK